MVTLLNFMQRVSEKARFFLKNPNVLREIMNLIEESSKKHLREKLIYLAGGWPQDPPPEFIKEAMKNVIYDESKFSRCYQYGPTRGLSETIEAIKDYEKEVYGRNIEEENIMIGNGSTELTMALFEILVQEESEIILTRPHYLNYYRQALLTSNMKARIKYWNLFRNYDNEIVYEPDLEELKSLITDKTSLILLTSPGNPDGQILSDELFRGISEIAKDKGIFLVTDLAYRGFCYTERPSYLSSDLEENQVFICTFSKELRIPGFRMAYIIASRALVKYLEVIEQTSQLCPNNLTQKILAELITAPGNLVKINEFIEKGRELYRKTAILTYEKLREISEFKILKPKGAFYLFFNHEKVERNSRKFCEELLKEQQVALAPGVDFGLDGYTRLSFSPGVLKPELILEGIERIKAYLGEGIDQGNIYKRLLL